MIRDFTDKELDLLEMAYLIFKSKDKHAREQLKDMINACDAGRIKLADQASILRQIIQSLPH